MGYDPMHQVIVNASLTTIDFPRSRRQLPRFLQYIHIYIIRIYIPYAFSEHVLDSFLITLAPIGVSRDHILLARIEWKEMKNHRVHTRPAVSPERETTESKRFFPRRDSIKELCRSTRFPSIFKPVHLRKMHAHLTAYSHILRDWTFG